VEGVWSDRLRADFDTEAGSDRRYPAQWPAQRAYGLLAEVRLGRRCSPCHRMPCDSRNEGSKFVSITWRAILARPHAEGPSKWVKHAERERFPDPVSERKSNASAARLSSSAARLSSSSSSSSTSAKRASPPVPALCLHSHEGTLMAGYADGYIRMFERRRVDDVDEDERERERERDDDVNNGGGNGGGGGGNGGGGGQQFGWFPREPCPTRAAHLGGMVTDLDTCRGRLVTVGTDATLG